MKLLLLWITVVFIGAIGIVTALDIIENGLSLLDVVAILILILFSTGIVGSLVQSLRDRD
jgi:hypothetical protein